MIKVCSKCKIEKPLTEFNKDKNTRDSYDYICKKCNREIYRAWVEKDPERAKQKWREASKRYNYKEKRLIRKYGIDSATKELMFNAQGGLCAICKDEKKLVVDHNHATGEVRGLLCNNCNIGLGVFTDNIALLQSAISYLNH